MKKKIYSSNQSIYIQLFLKNEVLLSKKSTKSFSKEPLIQNLNKPLGKSISKAYNETQINYSSLQYLFIQTKMNEQKNTQDLKKVLIQKTIESSMESGFIKKL